MDARLLYHFLGYCLLAALLAGAGGVKAQPASEIPTSSPLLPLSAYRNGRILTFSHDNKYWFEFQDEQGFLWGKDRYGIPVRYDGYEVKVFPVEPTSAEGIQCAGPLIYLKDSEGKIWLAIDWCGLDRYDPRTGQFEHLSDEIYSVRNAAPRSYYYLFEGSKKNIWIGTQQGLYKYSIADSSFSFAERMSHASLILEDRNGNIWAGNPITARFIRKIGPSGKRKEEDIPFPYIGDLNKINEFMGRFRAVSPPGEQEGLLFLISIGGHLYTFDVNSRAISPQTDGLLPGELIYSIFNDGITLVGTNKNRVLQYDHERRLFVPFLILPELSEQDGPVQYIFRSRDGLLWIVTQNRTFQVLPRHTPFKKARFPKNLRQPVPFGFDESVVLFKNNLFFHTDEGLQPVIEGEAAPIPIEFSDKDYEFPGRKGKAYPELDWLKTHSGFEFREDELHHELWMLLYQYPYGMKVFRFDENGRRTFQHYCLGRNNCFADHVMDMDISPEGKLWIAGWAGASCFDPETRQFTNYTQANGCLPDLATRSILCDSKDNVWIGTNSRGLARYDIKADTFEYFLHDPSRANTLTTDNLILGLMESRTGDIWVATGNGLNRYEGPASGFERFYEKDGLPFSQPICLIEDNNNNIWTASTYDLAKYGPKQEAFYTFSRSDGLPNATFMSRAVLKDGKGRLFFQVADGVAWFHPDSLQLDHQVPELFFTDFQLANQSVKVGDSTGILSQSIAFTEKITLKYIQNVFTIRYAAPEYLHPDKITYSFRLEGFDKRWRRVGDAREATYTNLSPGSYQFQVKCQNRHGFESDTTWLDVVILPPWYRTGWAYSLWAALLIGGFFAVYRFQLNRKLAQAEARRLLELDAVKTRLYTNITHEFRTPLTIIQGTAAQLMSKVNYTVREELKRIQRNGRQLLNLVNQMLDLAKPFEERELKARLKKLLENRERLREYYTSNGFIARRGQPLPCRPGVLRPAAGPVEDNLGDPAFSAEQLADQLFVSYATCLRKVKALANCTVKEYIRQIRIHRAAQLLLEEPGRNIGAIAADTGFNSNTHFTREFRKVMGCTPTEYRKQGK